MEWVNQVIRYCYDQGWSNTIYSSIILINYAIQFVFLMIYRKKYGVSAWRIFIAQLIIYPVSYYLMLVLAWIENGFTNWGANNIVRLFVYVPLVDYVVAKFVRIPAGKLIDISAPCMALDQAIGHTVCPFVGCCCGYTCSWGVWNPATNDLRFPNQWLECLVALIIAIYLLHSAKKENYAGTGRIYALFLVTFGTTRFFLEFLRDNEKLVMGISNLAFHALFMAVVGAVWIFVLAEKEREDRRKAGIRQQKRRK